MRGPGFMRASHEGYVVTEQLRLKRVKGFAFKVKWLKIPNEGILGLVQGLGVYGFPGFGWGL